MIYQLSYLISYSLSTTPLHKLRILQVKKPRQAYYCSPGRSYVRSTEIYESLSVLEREVTARQASPIPSIPIPERDARSSAFSWYRACCTRHVEISRLRSVTTCFSRFGICPILATSSIRHCTRTGSLPSALILMLFAVFPVTKSQTSEKHFPHLEQPLQVIRIPQV